jgi:hypothetical protein
MIFITDNVFISDKHELYLSAWGVNRLTSLESEKALEQLCKEYIGEIKMLNLRSEKDRLYIEESEEEFDNHVKSVNKTLLELNRYKNDKKLKRYRSLFNRCLRDGKTVMFINDIRRG